MGSTKKRYGGVWAWLALTLLAAGLASTSPPARAGETWAEKIRKLKNGAKQGFERAQQAVREHAPQVRKQIERGVDRTQRAIQRAAPQVKERVQQGAKGVQEGVGHARRAVERHLPRIQKQAQETWQHAGPAVRRGLDRARHDLLPKAQALGAAAHERVETALRKMDGARVKQVLGDLQGAFATHGPLVQEHVVRLYESGRDRIVPQVRTVVQRYGPRIEQALRDPELRDRAVDGLVTTLDVYDRVTRMKDRALAEALDLVGHRIPIVCDGRTMTLNEWAAQSIVERCPYFAGTTVAEEPIQALTYTLVCREPTYVVRELRVLKDRRGNAITIEDALVRSTGADAEGIVAALDVADKAMALRSSLRSGHGTLGAATGLVSSVRRYTEPGRRTARWLAFGEGGL